MKHRKNKIKRQHGIIKGLKKFLEKEISGHDFVSSIIPGEIKVGNSTGENLKIRYQYETQSGAKLIAVSGNSVQEIFVVTSDPEKLREIIDGYNG